ncbi:MAG: tRNA (guanosine(46)-N7)-methyltransferase TrmB [Spirochaetaceae bacterium]|nr:tRNA (guanosine(46)-N7)-methyltransferase TrmB [Spirochaetaceae bacterium]
MDNPIRREIKTFVLRASRMTDSQKRDYETLSTRWCIPFEKKPLNFADIFNNSNPVVVEIGFGMGAATAIIAEQNPNINYLGLEVHTPGVGRLLGNIRDKNLQNLLIVEHDAMEVLEYMIPDNSVSGFHVFFPDPWPKKKHHKRRLMQRPRTNLLSKKLYEGGYVYMATDWEPYAEFALEELSLTENLKNKYDGYAPHQSWRPETKFEHKGLLAERKICELFFEKTEE